jgi:AcrR family transcriptional regulator
MTDDTDPAAEPDLPPPAPPPAPPPTGTLEEKAVTALFQVAAREGWGGTSLSAIAEQAGLGLDELRARFTCRTAILDHFTRATDAAVLAGTMPRSEGENIKDRLFDMLMRRFDAFQSHRAGIIALAKGLYGDPNEALARLKGGIASMAWMLEGAGVPSHGLAGLLRSEALLVVALSAFRAWENDDSADLSATMAALDKALGRAEQAAQWFERLPGLGRS